ncbi:MAG: hypothetical protein QXD61_07375 [Candidatus Caldarchaeum sp.]
MSAYHNMKTVSGQAAPSMTSIMAQIRFQTLRRHDYNAVVEGDEVRIKST